MVPFWSFHASEANKGQRLPPQSTRSTQLAQAVGRGTDVTWRSPSAWSDGCACAWTDWLEADASLRARWCCSSDSTTNGRIPLKQQVVSTEAAQNAVHGNMWTAGAPASSGLG
jgi:hypothetical protein